jgi:hypothetical protein
MQLSVLFFANKIKLIILYIKYNLLHIMNEILRAIIQGCLIDKESWLYLLGYGRDFFRHHLFPELVKNLYYCQSLC